MSNGVDLEAISRFILDQAEILIITHNKKGLQISIQEAILTVHQMMLNSMFQSQKKDKCFNHKKKILDLKLI